MTLPEEYGEARIATPDEVDAFCAFCNRCNSGMEAIPVKFGTHPLPVLSSNTGDFVKWIRRAHPETPIDVCDAERLTLHASDIWLPLIFLAQDVTLPAFINMVTSYLYDRLRGSLASDRNKVHLSVRYRVPRSGAVAQFEYHGPVEGMPQVLRTARTAWDDQSDGSSHGMGRRNR